MQLNSLSSPYLRRAAARSFVIWREVLRSKGSISMDRLQELTGLTYCGVRENLQRMALTLTPCDPKESVPTWTDNFYSVDTFIKHQVMEGKDV